MIPLVFGMLVIVPPQAYDQIVEALGYPAGFVDFYQRHYLAFGSQFCPNPCIVLPTWNHLWFVVYLWVYTMALGGVLALAPGLLGWIERRLAPALSGALLLVVPPLLLAAYRLVLLPNFPSTHALFGDWYNHALFATVFLFGFVLARAAAIWEAMERLRWVALSLAAAFFLCFLAVWATRYGGMPLKILAGVAYGSYQWLCMVALLGFARRWFDRGFAGAALSHRCDLSVLHRAPDRDHHDRACVARPGPASLAGSGDRHFGHRLQPAWRPMRSFGASLS